MYGMTKSLVIDFVVLNKLDLVYEDLLYLHYILNPKLHTYNFKDYDTTILKENNYIKIDSNEEVHLRQKAINLLEYLSIESFKEFKEPKIIKKSKRKIKAEVVERIDEYRKLWKGKKRGSMGDKNACIDKLSRWMVSNPSYSFEDILKAAQIYLGTREAQGTYLQRADYFIYKQSTNKDEISRLSSFIDEIEIEEEEDWTSTLN